METAAKAAEYPGANLVHIGEGVIQNVQNGLDVVAEGVAGLEALAEGAGGVVNISLDAEVNAISLAEEGVTNVVQSVGQGVQEAAENIVEHMLEDPTQLEGVGYASAALVLDMDGSVDGAAPNFGNSPKNSETRWDQNLRGCVE